MRRDFCDRCGIDVTEEYVEAEPPRTFSVFKPSRPTRFGITLSSTDELHLCAPCYEQFGDWLKAGMACPPCPLTKRKI